jgi:signal transduction histidine kinase
MEDRFSERTRIAREQHDSLLQGFQGLMFRLQAVRQLLPGRPDDAAKFLESALQKRSLALKSNHSRSLTTAWWSKAGRDS